MSFSRMKPLPKALIIGSILVVIGYGVNAWLQSRPAPAPAVEAVKVETVTVPAEGTADAKKAAEQAVQAATAAAQAAPAPAPAAPSGLTPATSNAGLDAVLRSTK